MINIILERIRQKKRTAPYPREDIALPALYRGRPAIRHELCGSCNHPCTYSCPVDAIEYATAGAHVDLGRCLFCMECSLACPHKALSFTHDYKLAATTRAGLCAHDNRAGRDGALPRELADLFGQSLKLRQVSAAGCNACEADTNVLNTLTYDLGRFGIQFVASPRHADGILVTGPISKNMELALKKTYDAVPSPKIVIAVGSCAISGGIFRDHAETAQGLDTIIPVDLYIPGCPPHPYTILDGLLKLIGKVK